MVKPKHPPGKPNMYSQSGSGAQNEILMAEVEDIIRKKNDNLPKPKRMRGKGKASTIAGRSMQGVAALGTLPYIFDSSGAFSSKDKFSGIIGGLILAGIGEAIVRSGKKGKGISLAGAGTQLAGQGVELAGEGTKLAGEGVQIPHEHIRDVKSILREGFKKDEPISIRDLKIPKKIIPSLKRKVKAINTNDLSGSGNDFWEDVKKSAKNLAVDVVKHPFDPAFAQGVRVQNAIQDFGMQQATKSLVSSMRKNKTGKGIGDSLKKLVDKGKKEFNKFLDGKTLIKPSHVVAVLASGAGAASSLVPNTYAKGALMSLAVGGAMGAEALRQSGRGHKNKNQNVDEMKMADDMKMEGEMKMADDRMPLKHPNPLKGSGKRKEISKRQNMSYYEVWNGVRNKTRGGLTKEDLMISPSTGLIISKKRYALGVKRTPLLRKKA